MPLIGLERVQRAIDEKIELLNLKVRAVWIEGLGFIIDESPVHYKDGGRFKNSWFLSENTPSTGTRSADSNGSGSMASVARMPAYVLGKELWFVSNLPYSHIIEYGGYPSEVEHGTWVNGFGYQKLSSGGYSLQAPSGVVRVNVATMRAAL